VVADPQRAPLVVEEEAPDLMRVGDSGSAVVWTARCEGFLPLLCLRDRLAAMSEWELGHNEPKHVCPCPPPLFITQCDGSPQPWIG
jgi:hypothetical protein